MQEPLGKKAGTREVHLRSCDSWTLTSKGREAEAVRRFNEAIDTLPTSIYAHGAEQALKKHKTPEVTGETQADNT